MSATGLGELAGAVVGTGLQSVANSQAAAKQQQYTRENMHDALKNQMTLDRMATPLAVQGMRDAGLSPLSMNGPMKPSAAPSAPQGAEVKPVDMAAMAQAAANVRLTNAEAAQKEEDVSRMKNENTSAKVNVIQSMRDRIVQMSALGVKMDSAEIQDIQNRIDDLESNDNFNMGDLKGAMSAFQADKASVDKLVTNLEQIYKQINQGYLLRNHPLLGSQLDLKKLALESAQIALMGAQREEAQSSASLHDEQVEHLEKDIRRISQEIAESQARENKTKIDSKIAYQSSVNALWSDEEYMSALRAAGVNSFDELVKAAILAKGLKGAKGFNVAGGEVKTPVLKPLPSEKSSLGKLADWKSDKVSPFKFGSSDDNLFKALSARYGHNEANSRYADWLKRREKGQSFTDYYYKWKTYPDMKARSRQRLK